MYDICNKEMKHYPVSTGVMSCVGCAKAAPTTINVHAKLALEHGATIDELGEALRIVFQWCNRSTLVLGTEAIEEVEEN